MLNPAPFQQIQTGAPLSCFKYLPNATFDVATTQCANLRTNTTTQKSRFAWIQNKNTLEFLTTLITVRELNRNNLWFIQPSPYWARIGLYATAPGPWPFRYHLVDTLDTAGFTSTSARNMFYSPTTITYDNGPAQCVALVPVASLDPPGVYSDTV